MDHKAQILIDLDKLLKTIPKEHKKTVEKLARIYMELGAQKVLNLIQDLSEIPSNDIENYIIVHKSELEGGDGG